MIFVKKHHDKMEVLNKYNIHQKNLPMIERNERQTINMTIVVMFKQGIKYMGLAPITNFFQAW
jgi:hypothetical protein